MLTTPTSVPVAPECLYFKSFFEIMLYLYTCTMVPWYVHVYHVVLNTWYLVPVCHTRVPRYGNMAHSTMVLRYQWYHWYCTIFTIFGTNGTMVLVFQVVFEIPWYHGNVLHVYSTRVRTYVRTYSSTMVLASTYTCTPTIAVPWYVLEQLYSSSVPVAPERLYFKSFLR